jgi:predicted outer membrane protein
MNLAISGVLIGALAIWTSSSIGQQTKTTPRNTAPRSNDGARNDSSEHLDHHVAQCLILENQNEVAAARIAEKKGSNAEVKNFAQVMVKDHEQFTTDLDKFAGEHFRDRDTRAGAGAGRTAPAPRTTAPARSTEGKEGDHHAHAEKFMQIREEIADQCRASTQRELDSKQGKSFDECYMGMQIVAHMKMVDELTVLSRHVSSEFKPVLEKGLQTAQKHLDNAKQVMKDINDRQTADSK